MERTTTLIAVRHSASSQQIRAKIPPQRHTNLSWHTSISSFRAGPKTTHQPMDTPGHEEKAIWRRLPSVNWLCHQAPPLTASPSRFMSLVRVAKGALCLCKPRTLSILLIHHLDSTFFAASLVSPFCSASSSPVTGTARDGSRPAFQPSAAAPSQPGAFGHHLARPPNP